MAVQLPYLDAFQECLVLIVLIAIGYLCGKLKTFSVLDVSNIRRTLYLICIPAMLFMEISTHKLTKEIWWPLLNSLLTEISIHILLLIFVYAIPFHNKFEQFLDGIFSFAYVNFVYFACPIVRILYGSEYQYIPVIAGIVHFIIEPPIHSFLILQKEKFLENHIEEEEKSHNDDQTNASAINDEDDVEMEGFEGTDHQTNTSPEEEVNEEDSKPEPMWKKIFFMLVTPMFVCTIIGIIWSATGYNLPDFISTFVDYLERSVMATGLFTVGVFMSDHPFFGCNWFEVGAYLIIHFVAMPLISAFWSWVLKFDNKTAQICALIHALPTGLTGYVMAINSGHGLKAASFTFFWSNILCLPVFMLWVTVFNETGLFSTI